jgi:L-rhamnose mutarotase
MTRMILTLDLKDDPALIALYRKHHAAVWPEVLLSLRRIGVRNMDIYALGRRLVMVLETAPGFDLTTDFALHRASDPRCEEWEELMKTLQQPPPGAPPGLMWTPMECVFSLSEQLSPERRRPRWTGALRVAEKRRR